jgi:cell division inhibitor SulA
LSLKEKIIATGVAALVLAIEDIKPPGKFAHDWLPRRAVNRKRLLTVSIYLPCTALVKRAIHAFGKTVHEWRFL